MSMLLGLIILILDIFAIVGVLSGSSTPGRKLLWVVVILVFPVVGLIIYYLVGRSSADNR